MSAAFPQVGTTLCVRLPCDTRKTFGLLARSRGMTPSGLLRSLIDQEIAGRPGTEPGEVEAAVRFELSGRVIRLGAGCHGGQRGEALWTATRRRAR